MVRGQTNQLSAFDSSGHAPLTHRRVTWRNKIKQRSAQINAVPDQSLSPPDPSEDRALTPQSIAPIAKGATKATKQQQKSAIHHAWKDWQWPIVWIGTLGIFGSMGLIAYFWLASLPPLPDCRTITPLSSDGHRLYCAQEMARSGKLEDLATGISLVKNWSPKHPLYSDAQQSLTQWSRRVMLVARERMHQNDFKGAIDAISKIPQSSPVYEEAQKTSEQWQEQWQEGEALYAKAIEAMKQQDWRSAFDQVTELGYLEHDYWRLQQADILSKQIFVQKESQEALTQAQKLAKKAEPEQLGEAVALLQTVAPESEVWAQAQTLLADWSQRLLKTALLAWQEGDTSDAIHLAQKVPLDLQLSPEAHDLVKFSHAYKLIEESHIESKLSWRQIWSLLEATTAMQQIQTDSPIYPEAQARLQDWQAQLQDLKQLQFANLVADWGQKPGLEYAITQVKQIKPNQQRYDQAQAMIANWIAKIEQLEDLPYLQLAQQFAARNAIPDLRLAIAQAQVIPSQRSVWSDVQTQIVAWQQQIEKLEDQPILDRAEALAKANQLDEAIAVAAEIRPNRFLSVQAQIAIATWQEKIRAVEVAKDQSVLDQARSFAGQGQLTDAIATANQLSPGRPLYLEAQAAIGTWLRDRDGDKAGSAESTDLADSAAADVSIEDPSDLPSEVAPGSGDLIESTSSEAPAMTDSVETDSPLVE